ncbi:MAG: DNA repair protein RecO [Verrucomicrobia bacterium]|nr:MAG: DNA repair protein RecO [Verrucomicrobiota bacterium]
MIESATGLILRTRPLTETSLIVHWLTPNLGRLATVAKGARRPKSPFRGKLDLFYLADFSFNRSRCSELHALREVSLRETYPLLRQELACLQQVCYCAALVEQATEIEATIPGVFDVMSGMLKLVVQSPKSKIQSPTSDAHSKAIGIFAFELKLVRELGLAPDLDKTRLSAGSRQIVKALTNNEWPMLARIQLSKAQRLELQQFLHGFLIFHLGRIPKGRSAALG